MSQVVRIQNASGLHGAIPSDRCAPSQPDRSEHEGAEPALGMMGRRRRPGWGGHAGPLPVPHPPPAAGTGGAADPGAGGQPALNGNPEHTVGGGDPLGILGGEGVKPDAPFLFFLQRHNFFRSTFPQGIRFILFCPVPWWVRGPTPGGGGHLCRNTLLILLHS